MWAKLDPMTSTDISQRGRTIVYLSGATELLFEAFFGGKPVGRFQIPAGGQVTLPETFDSLKIQNMGSVYTESEYLLIEGEYQRLSDVSIVQVAGITNTITAQIVNQLTAKIVDTVDIRQITETLTAEISNTVDIRQITETLTAEVTNEVNVRQITETLKNRPDSGAAFSVVSYVFDASGVIEIPSNPLRKELVILASEANSAPFSINGFDLDAGDEFSLENFVGSLSLSGVEGLGFKFLQVLYED